MFQGGLRNAEPAFFMINFRKRIFQRTTRITNRFPTTILRTMQMSKGNIIKTIKHRRIDIIKSTNRNLLGIRTLGASHKLMSKQYIPF